MANSIEAYCSKCKTTRTFRLVETSAFKDTYECYYCSSRKNTMTPAGMAYAGYKILRLGLIIIGFPPFPDP